MVGRWKDGTSIVHHPDSPASRDKPVPKPDNDFLFDDDRGGVNCPFGAHVRRANPRKSLDPHPDPDSDEEIRVSNRHRILRVGRTYQRSIDSGKKGLLFMCVNADIERQFEFIQQNWIHGRSFHGLESEMDPLIGPASSESLFTIPTPSGPLRVKSLARVATDSKFKSFVRVRGGGYFFLPGRRAFRFLIANESTANRSGSAKGQYDPPE